MPSILVYLVISWLCEHTLAFQLPTSTKRRFAFSARRGGTQRFMKNLETYDPHMNLARSSCTSSDFVLFGNMEGWGERFWGM